MSETYTSGRWVVKDGEEDAFVDDWTAFAKWASTVSGSGTFRLLRDLDHPRSYMSFADWDSFEAQDAWKQHSEFVDHLGRARAHCEDFQSLTFELVTTVE